MTKFRDVLLQYVDNTFLSKPDMWRAFLGALAEAHEQDIGAQLDQGRAESREMLDRQRQAMHEMLEHFRRTEMPGHNTAKGLPLKDLKPNQFESNKKSEQSFKQWAEDLAEWTARIDRDYSKAFKVAQELQEWSEVKRNAEMVKEGIHADKIDDIDHQLLVILKRLTKGEARDVVDTVSSGGEAWYRLHDRFYSKTVTGATSIANRLGDVKRPQSMNESYHLLTEIRGLIKEFQRQSPHEPLPTAVIKSAYMRVVPETYRKGLEMQIDVDRCSTQAIEDKIMQFIRSNSTGPVGMDTNAFQQPKAWDCWNQESWGNAASTYGGGPSLNHFYDTAHEDSGEADFGEYDAMAFYKGKGKDKGKGKGKGGFKGSCYHCGKYGHSQRYCFSKGKGANGKGVGQPGKGAQSHPYGGKGTPVQLVSNDEEQGQPEGHQRDALLFEAWQTPRRPAKTSSEGREANQRDWAEVGNRYAALADSDREASSLQLLEMGELHNLQSQEWTPLPKPMVIDSGAGETVLPASWLPEHPTEESLGSKNNDYYVTADGSRVYNEGKKEVTISSADGTKVRDMTFQVANVKKALGSVSQMVRRGNKVVFDRDDNGKDLAYIENKRSKERMYMRQEKGVYVLDVLVAPPQTKPFGRQA